MRPPVLPSGNVWRKASIGLGAYWRFNEAAGFTQRKRNKRTKQTTPKAVLQ